jgi:hypothetical protein
MPVYFVQGAGLTKVGYAESPEGRLRKLQTGSPVSLHLVRILDGTDRDEVRLHEKFAPHHSHGEWFRLTDEQVFADYFGLKEIAPHQATHAIKARKRTGIAVKAPAPCASVAAELLHRQPQGS